MLNNECNFDFIVAMHCPNMNRVGFNPVKPSASEQVAMTLIIHVENVHVVQHHQYQNRQIVMGKVHQGVDTD